MSRYQPPIEPVQDPLATTDFGNYQSVFSYKYSRPTMRANWSEKRKAQLQRVVQATSAETLGEATTKLVSKAEAADLWRHRDDIDIPTIMRRELDSDFPGYTGHDQMAALSQYGDVAKKGRRVMGQGMTSDDTASNVEAIQTREGLNIVEKGLVVTLDGFGEQIEEWKGFECNGLTHLQVAEPITVGFRIALHAQDYLTALKIIRAVKEGMRTKGIKGPVGTSAELEQLLHGTGMDAIEFERRVMNKLGLEPYIVAGQTTPRMQTVEVVYALSTIGIAAHKFAGDVKILQSTPFDEWAEPRNRRQVGSLAMPHKRNPTGIENMKALARSLPGKVFEAYWNASEVTLERGMEDSGGKRSYLPESFLIVDELLKRSERVIRGIQIHKASIARNLKNYGAFSALAPIMAEAAKRGADRQDMHALLFDHTSVAIEKMREGGENQLQALIANDPDVLKFIDASIVHGIFENVGRHIGNAEKYCDMFLQNELYPAIGKKV